MRMGNFYRCPLWRKSTLYKKGQFYLLKKNWRCNSAVWQPHTTLSPSSNAPLVPLGLGVTCPWGPAWVPTKGTSKMRLSNCSKPRGYPFARPNSGFSSSPLLLIWLHTASHDPFGPDVGRGPQFLRS